MATPDIGRSITEGYGRALDRLGQWFPALAAIAVVIALVDAVAAQVSSSFVPDAGEIFRAAFAGDAADIDASDLRIATIVGAVASLVSYLVGFGAYALFGGLLHRERHGAPVDTPSPGGAVAAAVAYVGALMPKLAILAGLVFVAQVAGVVLGGIGGLVSLVCWIVAIYLSIRWIYASIIVGAGEATGDAAFERSEQVVQGAWWRTLGCFIVIGLATVVPIAIAGAIIGAILPGAFVAALVSSFVTTLVGVPIFASALESAWAQVEGAAADPGQQHPTQPQQDLPPHEPPPGGGPFV